MTEPFLIHLYCCGSRAVMIMSLTLPHNLSWTSEGGMWKVSNLDCMKVWIYSWLACLFISCRIFHFIFQIKKKKTEFRPHNTKPQTIQNCRTWLFEWRTEMFIELNQYEHLLTEQRATMGFQNLRKLSPSAVRLCTAIITILEHFSATLSKRNTSVCLMDFWKPTRFIGA